MFDDNKTLPPLRVPIAPEMDATMPGRRVLDPVAEPADIDATMPGKRDRKPDGMFDIGDLIMNRYKVLSKLGQGGMGVVYKCFDETAGVEIALKALPPELSHNTLEMEDIRRNFQIVHNLHHPHIASYNNLECDPANGYYYLIMECCAGEDLRRWIRYRHESGTLNFIEVISIIQQVAIALDYAHSMKIIHRDIKPGNIMIDQLGKVKVLDFGLAAQIHTSMTRVSMVYHGTSGTGPYMAPEQWRGRLQDVRADQYALAVMTYEMLAGHLPFESSDVTVLREAVLNEKPAPIRNIPDFAQKAIDRAMSKDPVQRFATCGEFVAALSKAPVKPALFRKRIPLLAHGVALVIAALLAWFIFFGKEKTVPPPALKSEIAALIIDANNAKESKNWDEYYRLLLKILELDTSNKEAQNNLGWCYEKGYGVKQDHTEAVKWYRKAAEQGDAQAQFNLGWCYDNGYGVKQDYAEAVKWYRKAAEQGDADAQYNLGLCYAEGKGVKQDHTEAVKWFRKAAEQGHADAAKALKILQK